MNIAHSHEQSHQRDQQSERPAKRRWREIESIQERRRLQRELEEMDGCLDFSMTDLEI